MHSELASVTAAAAAMEELRREQSKGRETIGEGARAGHQSEELWLSVSFGCREDTPYADRGRGGRGHVRSWPETSES
eukprot:3915201-Prymnesium_polylepis.2